MTSRADNEAILFLMTLLLFSCDDMNVPRSAGFQTRANGNTDSYPEFVKV
jgi:hypothetical protein